LFEGSSLFDSLILCVRMLGRSATEVESNASLSDSEEESEEVSLVYF